MLGWVSPAFDDDVQPVQRAGILLIGTHESGDLRTAARYSGDMEVDFLPGNNRHGRSLRLEEPSAEKKGGLLAASTRYERTGRLKWPPWSNSRFPGPFVTHPDKPQPILTVTINLLKPHF